MKEDLLDLTKRLRRRLEQSHESDFALGARAKPKAAPAAAAAPAGDAFTKLAQTVAACRLCPLGSQRLNAVFGVGPADAEVVFIGEGPGYDEDHKGEPFIGRSGQLLDKIMESIGLSRTTNAYIANIVKCHPMQDPSDPEARGNDRPPTPEEMAACKPYLDEQILLIDPKALVTLGASPAKALLGPGEPITKIRGQWREYTPAGSSKSYKLMPTFHPAALLRNPNLKKDVWADMKALRAVLQETP